MSNHLEAVRNFIQLLGSRAKYGLRGEKPLAILAATKYIHDYICNRYGTTPQALAKPDKRGIRDVMFDIMKMQGF